MKISVRPGHLTPLRHRVRGWAGVLSTGQGVEFAVAQTENGQTRVTREARVGAVSELRSQFDPGEYHVVTSVGAEDVFCQTLRLPTAETTELKQMLDLQLDQLTPLPPEEVVYDFEPLEVREGQTQVLIAIARKSAVNDRVEALEQVGVTAEIVGIEALAVFRGLMEQAALPRDEKLGVLVGLKSGGAVVVLFTGGRPLAVRSVLLGGGSLEAADTREVLREELQRTLLAEQAQAPGRELGGITFLVQEESVRPAAEELSRGWGMHVDCLSNGAVPPPATSLCLDHAVTTQRRLNLLPEEWRQRRQSARLRRLWWRGAKVAIVLYVVAVVASVVIFGIRKSQLAGIKAEKAAIESKFRDARQLEGELTAMRLQLETKYSALDVLRQVSELMPPNLKLSTFVFRRNEAVTLKGQADNAQAVLDFIDRLTHCDLFSDVKTSSMNTPPGGSLTKFELLATLKSAAGKPTGGGTWR